MTIKCDFKIVNLNSYSLGLLLSDLPELAWNR